MEVLSLLIVDDEQYICDSVILKIGRLQHPVTYKAVSCNNGNSALELLEKNHFDAVITDIRMPFMTGIALIRAAREKGFAGKIFVLSGYDDFSYVRDAFTSGADDYLLKPVSVSELDQKLRLLLLSAVGQKTEEPESMQPGQYRSIVSYAEEYIRTHYRNSTLNMEEVANHVSVSYSYFSSLFRRETGMTFPAYLRKVRIEKAIEYLRDPGMRIAEICYRIGFKYPQQLSNDFKKVTGVYPSEYFGEQAQESRCGAPSEASELAPSEEAAGKEEGETK